MIFLALAALCAKSIRQIWAKGILAGLAVGMNLMEGFDVGAILCVYVGLFIVWQIFTEETPGIRKVLTALGTEVVVIFFSAFIAAHSISSLVNTQVVGVAGSSQDEQTKEERWDPATQWSLPKIETLRVICSRPLRLSHGRADHCAGQIQRLLGNCGPEPKSPPSGATIPRNAPQQSRPSISPWICAKASKAAIAKPVSTPSKPC